MQKWEYLVVDFFPTAIMGEETGYSVNGKFIPHNFKASNSREESKVFAEFRSQRLNEWGEQGWELVTEHYGGHFILKRPKS